MTMTKILNEPLCDTYQKVVKQAQTLFKEVG